HAELRHRLGQLGPVELDDRGLGPGHPHPEEPVECPLAGDAEDLGAEVEVGERLTKTRVPRGITLPGDGEEPVARLGEDDLHADDVEDAALVLERRDHERPALVELAEEVLAWHLHGVEEDLVELGVAGHLAERSHRDARAPHVDQQARDALRAPRLGVGPAEEHGPVGVMPERRPGLLAGHLEGVALERRLGAERGEVGARPRLGEAEAPEVLGGQDARGEALLLRLGAVGEDRRPRDADAEVPDDLGRPRPAHLLDVGDLFRDARVAPAVRSWPGDADPARVGQLVLPGAKPALAFLIGQARRVLGPQVATGEAVTVIDALAVTDLSPLFPALRDPAVPVVLHGGGQDLEIFATLMRGPVRGVVDTQVEAAFLGHGFQVGLSVLLERVLKVRIRKDQTYTDWTRRPLRPEQLAYAGDDVLHLLPLHDALRAELARRERAAWVEEELRGLEDPARFADMPPEECYTTVKGWQRLGGREAAILRALAAWRDRSARRANVRPNFIANDVVLTSLA